MRIATCLLVVLMMCSCASQKDIQCDSAPSKVLSADSQRISALMIVSQVREIQAKTQSSSLVTGFWGAIARSVPGTEATNLASKVRQLRIMMADQQALTLAPGSPLPPRSKWACEMLASSIAAVDTSLSNRAFLDNLKVVEDHFVRVYRAQGGKNFDADLKALGD